MAAINFMIQAPGGGTFCNFCFIFLQRYSCTGNYDHRHLSNIDSLSFVMCLLLAQAVIGFFSFFFAMAVYSTNEANKAGSTRR